MPREGSRAGGLRLTLLFRPRWGARCNYRNLVTASLRSLIARGLRSALLVAHPERAGVQLVFTRRKFPIPVASGEQSGSIPLPTGSPLACCPGPREGREKESGLETQATKWWRRVLRRLVRPCLATAGYSALPARLRRLNSRHRCRGK